MPKLHLDIEKEFSWQELPIKGQIPAWLQGTLFRNGPVLYEIDNSYPVHWFDGLGMLIAFKIDQGKVYFSNKFLRSDAYEKVTEEQSPHYLGFACDPCHALFKRIFTSFFPSSHCDIHNANVNIAKYADRFVGLTETPLPVLFDENTLATLGTLEFKDSLPKENVFESAHPHVSQGEYINYIVRYGIKSLYQIYKLPKDSHSRELLAEVAVEKPAYMHTFSLTENYVIFAEYPFKVTPLALYLSEKPFIKNYHWQDKVPTRFLFINRNTKKLEKEFYSEPFFCFHHINAYEQNRHVILDLIAYPDASIIETVGKYGQKNYSASVDEALSATKVLRFNFSLDQDLLFKEILFEGAIEFPRINMNKDAAFYRYFYGVDIRESIDSPAIYKMNMQEKSIKTWQEIGSTSGEPVFISSPQSNEEDAGVIAAVIFNKNLNTSELLLLDAETMEEIARAAAPLKIPLGLHGQFYSKKNTSSYQS